jgi:hypothetical protein
MVTDGEGAKTIPFSVSESLATLLEAQRVKLDQVDVTKPGKLRYAEARAQGCFTAVAKGAKNRQLKPNQIFIPGTELRVADGTLRISVFRASVPCDYDDEVLSVTFQKDGPDYWYGYIELDPQVNNVETKPNDAEVVAACG